MTIIGDAITFGLNVSRADAVTPAYDITLALVLFLPLEDILNASIDPEAVVMISQSSNGSQTTLNLTQLTYTAGADRSDSLFSFSSVIGRLAYVVPFIQLNGILEYQSMPSNGRVYNEPIIFPAVFVRNAELTFDLQSTSLDVTNGSLLVLGEVAVRRASIRNVVGGSADLTLLVELDGLQLIISNYTIHSG